MFSFYVVQTKETAIELERETVQIARNSSPASKLHRRPTGLNGADKQQRQTSGTFLPSSVSSLWGILSALQNFRPITFQHSILGVADVVAIREEVLFHKFRLHWYDLIQRI